MEDFGIYTTQTGTVNPWSTVNPYLAIMDSAVNVGTGIANTVVNYKNNKLQSEAYSFNKEMAEKQFAYQQALNNKLMEREDNAIQRRVADMEKAGINPVLAAGSGASASAGSVGGSQVSAPTMSKFEKMQSMLAIAQAYQEQKNLMAEIELKKAEVDSVKLDNDLKDWDKKIKPIVMAREILNAENAKKDGAYKDLEIVRKAMDNAYESWRNNRSYTSGIDKDAGGPVSYVREAHGALQNIMQMINYAVKERNRRH